MKTKKITILVIPGATVAQMGEVKANLQKLKNSEYNLLILGMDAKLLEVKI